MKIFRLIGLLALSVASIIYSYQPQEYLDESSKVSITVFLEGAFATTGEVAIFEGMSVASLVKTYGVKQNANMAALDMDHIVHGEESLYLPVKNKQAISLNHASKEKLMTLHGVGEKTADKIIAFRREHPFETLEDIMKVNGIGQKRYEQYRDYLCL